MGQDRSAVMKKHQLVEKYFGNILKHSHLLWTYEQTALLKDAAELRDKESSSMSGRIITSLSRRTVWFCIIAMLGIVWTYGAFWKRRLSAG
jgi:hypothetical protein